MRFEHTLRRLRWYRGPTPFMNASVPRQKMAKAVVDTIRGLQDHLRGQIKPEDYDFVTYELLPGCQNWINEFREDIQRQISLKELDDILSECKILIASLRKRFDFKPGIPGQLHLGHVIAWSRAEGLIVSNDLAQSSFSHRSPSRRLMGQLAIQFIPNLKVFMHEEVQRLTSHLALLPLDETIENLRVQERLFVADFVIGTRYWILEFTPEIKALGGDPVKLLAQSEPWMNALNELSPKFQAAIQKLGGKPRFPDVPFRHWAEYQIQELRDVGILSGYPDGRFRG